VLVTQNFDVFFFKEGYMRTSSEIFSLDNFDNAFIHLTNNAVIFLFLNKGLKILTKLRPIRARKSAFFCRFRRTNKKREYSVRFPRLNNYKNKGNGNIILGLGKEKIEYG
jgi:hypothetical protein